MSTSGYKDLSGNNPNVLEPLGTTKLSGTFTGTGQSSATYLRGVHSVELNFGTGSVTLERSLDDGVTFVSVVLPDGTTAATFTADAAFELDAGKAGGLYRFNCTSYTSDITYKVV